MALGYGFIGYDILDYSISATNHLRHFLTTGAFGLSFFLVMVIISTVHTGRDLKTDVWVFIGVILIIISTFLRCSIAFFPEYAQDFYLYSALLWVIPFIVFMFKYNKFLLAPRADGIKG
jgi:uncharacterized protein involved in response to NO